MKNCEKRWKPDRRNSVIASLMGINEVNPKPPFHEKRRGLSESYLRNAASIGLRPGSLVSVRRSCSTYNEGVQASRCKNITTSDRFVNSKTGSVRKASSLLFGNSNGSRKSISKIDEHCAKHDDSVRKSLDSQLEMIDNTCCFSNSASAFKTNSEKLVYDLKDDELDVHFSPAHREHRNFKHELIHREPPDKSPVSLGHSCIACSRAMNRISQQERCRSKFEAVLRFRSNSHHPQTLLHRSSLADESKKQNLRRWEMAKKVQEFGVSLRNQTLNQILALADRISKQQSLCVKPGITDICNPTSKSSSHIGSIDVEDDASLKSLPGSESEAMKDILSTGLTQCEPIATENNSKEQTTVQNNDLESKSGKGSEQFQISLGVDEAMSPDSKVSELSSFSCFGPAFNNPEAYILGLRDEMDNSFENSCSKDDEPSATIGVYSGTRGVSESGLNLGTKLEEVRQYSAVEEIFSKEASLIEYFKEEPAYSNFSAIGPPGSLENLKRTNHQSPDSVLESFDIKSSSFECFDSTGLLLQLESLNFDAEETYSEGSVMLVSGDEDAEEECGIPFHDSKKVKRWLGDSQSRNFSYMVDVLDEAGFCGMNSYMDFKMWHSLECPVSPLVFEALEKKYGKQTSWRKSERRLLFDRITSGLMEIFNPIINFHADTTCIRRRFCDSFRLDEVVDELWMKLVSQDSEKSNELSKKALDKWFEVEEGIDIICRELEASLFDDMVMEFASLWDR